MTFETKHQLQKCLNYVNVHIHVPIPQIMGIWGRGGNHNFMVSTISAWVLVVGLAFIVEGNPRCCDAICKVSQVLVIDVASIILREVIIHCSVTKRGGRYLETELLTTGSPLQLPPHPPPNPPQLQIYKPTVRRSQQCQ